MTSLTNPTTALIKLDHQQIVENSIGYLDGLAAQWLAAVVALESDDFQQIKLLSDSLYEFGVAEQKQFWALNQRLKYPLQKLMAESRGGGKVTLLLRELQIEVLKIKPPKQTLLGRFKSMFLLMFSWHESVWDMWVAEYPTVKQQINAIVFKLEQHKRQLSRDNNRLLADQRELQLQLEKLTHCYDFVSLLESKVQAVNGEVFELISSGKDLIDNDFLPPIQQRIIELHQQILIARQVVLTLDLFIAQNETQTRGIDQAIYTSTTVIDVTAGISMLKKNQQNLAHEGETNVQLKQIKSSVNTQQLKQARQVIDQALFGMDEAQQKAHQNIDELNSNFSVYEEGS